MAKVIDDRTQVDPTVKIFDSFYATKLVVPSDQYDVVHSYFLNICDTEKIANNFTAFLFRIAQETKTDALALLQELKSGENKLRINQIMAYYLNSLKSKTSLYGVAIIPKPNLPVARNIVQ